MIQLAILLLFLALIVYATAQETTAPQPAPTMKYYVFSEQCFEAFFVNNDWLNVECLKKVTIRKCRRLSRYSDME
jgi:hypothetical protein